MFVVGQYAYDVIMKDVVMCRHRELFTSSQFSHSRSNVAVETCKIQELKSFEMAVINPDIITMIVK